eukprot:6264708-Amphidinium_carterae.1
MAEWLEPAPETYDYGGRGFESHGHAPGTFASAVADVVGHGAVAHRGIMDAEIEAIGGLKDAARSVGKLPILRDAGRLVRVSLEKLVRSQDTWRGE